MKLINYFRIAGSATVLMGLIVMLLTGIHRQAFVYTLAAICFLLGIQPILTNNLKHRLSLTVAPLLLGALILMIGKHSHIVARD